ncbi:uncharacterized protein GLRG_05708 [Colletotrichum graminicola M1.001]|uniref:Uncharacterized protein n=1 Tax=Colletotrichum graminicola (strain M1.001 / M2 / FGSC 10212) TaxID=645133 RepID=E3QIF4_COLGM|nr:uncharacterized protein GLRG_05708 [Colletotrichum graminicola M1.001]EFQ30564.1 hypothetical protein GLRG_05708 [Colletotrichum graminicola M1.001]
MAQATPTAQEKPCPVEKRTTQEVIDKLGLIPNEEKGYFIEAFRDPEASSNRISYLLEACDQAKEHVKVIYIWPAECLISRFGNQSSKVTTKLGISF